MTLELNLNFPSPGSVTVTFDGDSVDLSFQNPLEQKDMDELRRYLEVYPVQYMTDIDDNVARQMEARLPETGRNLFKAVFYDSVAKRWFDAFQDEEEPGRLLTISASHPEILSLPWELLRDPEGVYLCNENPRISIRRKLKRVGGGRKKAKIKTKDNLHLLFVVSRPADAGFINPRTDPRAVMDALEKHAPGRVSTEFLRPATLTGLVERLENSGLPRVDILHFDGHGAYDPDGRLAEEGGKDKESLAEFFANADLRVRKDEAEAGNMGYLLFEDEDGERDLVSSAILGEMLNRQKVGLVVLSACQSAKMGGEDAMGSVSARLTHAGIPAVIAMTHSVLVATTGMLFGEFYKHLATGKPIGESLDNARRLLQMKPERGKRRRGQETVPLTMQDWFLPALYQTGSDVPLLRPSDTMPAEISAGPPTGEGEGKLPPPPEAGFWGRSVELWALERAFMSGARRVSVTGFGGQGKTVLAAEAGSWLVRSGMFDVCCFVSFAAFQGVDPVESAVFPALRTVLNDSLTHEGDDVKALAATPVLLILDNLESLKDGDDRQAALLDAAVRWSRAGNTRVLITTRQDRLDHPEYAAAMQREHQYLPLSGLAEHDAVDYFPALWALPPAPDPQIEAPKRHGLVELFKMVDFHPLSVGLLAYQLKTRKVAELGERMESLLADAPGDGPEKNLRASLDLSLERLSPEARKWLPGLGVFHGGAMEDVLLQVTALGKTDENPKVAEARQLLEALKSGDPIAVVKAVGFELSEGIELPEEIIAQLFEGAEEQISKMEAALAKEQQTELAEGADESTWPLLRRALETAGLIRAEHLQGVPAPYLKFHPALTQALWERLPDMEKESLSTRYRAAYYRLSGKLFDLDDKDPYTARAVALREMPNLLFAVKAALAAGEEDAVFFVNNVNRFLGSFGMLRDRDDLNNLAEKDVGPGTKAWYLNQYNKGEALIDVGHHREAEAVFRNILEKMEDTFIYERQATLSLLGRCLTFSGHTKEAASVYREGIAISEKLEQSYSVRRQTGALQAELANALMFMGDYFGARSTYEAVLELMNELNDNRSVAVIQAQLGTLSIYEGNLAEAERRHQEALKTFRRINEPAHEAKSQNQLGMLYDKAKQWDAAEAAFREAARLYERLGNLADAAETYSNLAVTMMNAGRPTEAETWFRRAMEGSRQADDYQKMSRAAGNLADLLQSDTARLSESRLAEARQLAEQALAIKKTLDPGAAEIWKTYNILAEIAEKQGEGGKAREYRRLGREAQDNFLPNKQKRVQITAQFKDVIEAVVAGCEGNEEARKQVEELFDTFKKGNWRIVDAIQDIWAGERDEEKLVEKIDYNSGVIIRAILATLRGEDVFQNISENETSNNERPSADPQQLQIALAAALPVLNPEARSQVEPILDQLKQGGFTALAEALTNLWNGERDAAKLCEGLDEQDTATMRLALHLIAHPEEVEKMMT